MGYLIAKNGVIPNKGVIQKEKGWMFLYWSQRPLTTEKRSVGELQKSKSELVQRVQQVGHLVVAKLEGADAILKQLDSMLECTVTLSDLVLTVRSEKRAL